MSITQPILLGEDLSAADLRVVIREELLSHLENVGLIADVQETPGEADDKVRVRAKHAAQREDYRYREDAFIKRRGLALLGHFADGRQVVPERVEPVLCPVSSGTEDGDLFRLATLLWSVPVSRGYGRRMRFLVRDGANGKLIGLFALADPVFNLRARDKWIGWSSDDRKQRLVNVMDAHVVGAVPPYGQLLGGKVVASLMTSKEVCEAFAAKYSSSKGIISKEYKHAQLALITVTSALGRSSLYNRLKLPGILDFQRIGMTEGWGHFQIPDRLFLLMRRLLELEGHKYASGHQYGKGPNWRMRVVREALQQVGLNPDMLMRHGISREIFAAPLATNWREFLSGNAPILDGERPSAAEIGRLAVTRWLVPRAGRVPTFDTWTRFDTWNALIGVGSTGFQTASSNI